MADEAGWSYWSLVPRFKPGAFAPIGNEADKAGKAAGTRLGTSVGNSTRDRIGKDAKRIVAPLAGAFAAVKVADFFKDAVGGASDLNETVSLNRVIFKKDADEILAWSKNSTRAFGLSQQAALQATGQFGDMFSQLGFGRKETVAQSKAVVKLAADLGSFKNLKTEDVLERIAAGFRGEYDSLQLLIPNINAARVEKAALAATGKDVAKSLTAEEKAAATLAIIQKDGAAAQGDFARTSDELANSSKVLTAEWADAKAEIGQELLPAIKDVTHFLADEGVPAFLKLADEVGPIAKDVLPAVGEGFKAAADLGKPLVPMVKGIAAGFAALPDGAQKVAVLAGAVLLLKKHFDISLPSMRSYRDEATQAAAKSFALKAGAGAAGLGLLAIADHAGGASSALGSVATVGGSIAIGFATAGPVGAAIGAATGLLSVFGQKSKDAAKAQAELDSAAKSVADTLNQQTGALTKATRAAISKQFADKGVYDAAFLLGVSIKDVTDAALGNADALARVTDALGTGSAAHELTSKNANLLRDSIGSTTRAIDDERHSIDQVGVAMDDLDGKKAKVKVTTSGVGGAISGLRTLRDLLNGIGSNAKVNVKVPGMFDPDDYDSGGWTGPGAKMKPAGIVHADEFVVRKAARQKAERDRPGALDRLNRTGQWPGYDSGGRVGAVPGSGATGSVAILDSSIESLAEAIADLIYAGADNAVDSQAQYTNQVGRMTR